MMPLTVPQGRICVFACRWCAMLGAERAGRERLPLPSGLRVIPVACAGSVSADTVIAALLNGAAGVAVLGCHLGGCRHNDANRDAHARLSTLGDLLDAVGLDSRRLLLSWGTAHEAAEYAQVMRRFAADVASLPPLPVFSDGQTAGNPPAYPAHSTRPAIAPIAPIAGAQPPRPAVGLGEDTPLRSAAAKILSEPGHAVFGLRSTPFGATPSLFTAARDLEHLVAGPKRPLAATLARILRDRAAGSVTPGPEDKGLREAVLAKFPSGTLHAACRACDARALLELAAMRQLPEGMPALIPIPCSQEQIKACRCERFEWPDLSGVSGLQGTSDQPGGLSGSAPVSAPLSGKDETLSPLAPDRLVRWQQHFANCVQCHWCRAACPVCVCPVCALDEDASLPAGSLPPSPLGYHLARAMHIADKCVGCGACEDACPQGLPLMALHRALAQSLRRLDGYVSGAGLPSPLLEERRTERAAAAAPQWLTCVKRSGGEPA